MPYAPLLAFVAVVFQSDSLVQSVVRHCIWSAAQPYVPSWEAAYAWAAAGSSTATGGAGAGAGWGAAAGAGAGAAAGASGAVPSDGFSPDDCAFTLTEDGAGMAETRIFSNASFDSASAVVAALPAPVADVAGPTGSEAWPAAPTPISTAQAVVTTAARRPEPCRLAANRDSGDTLAAGSARWRERCAGAADLREAGSGRTSGVDLVMVASRCRRS
ncbi:hypothetical protein D9M72_315780 [compost metagenome]